MYQEVMRNRKLSAEAKAIYAYLSSLSGFGGSCYPSMEIMQEELCMSKNRLAKHMGQLIAFGIVEKVRERNGNIYGRNTYKITHESEVAQDLKRIFEAVENEAVEARAVEFEAVEFRPLENKAINNNSLNNNSLNNNSCNIAVCPEPETSSADSDIPDDNQPGENRYTQVGSDENGSGSNITGNVILPEAETASDGSDILLPLVDKSEYNVPLSKIEQWQQAYPAVDIRQELLRMISWLDANPKRKKTRRGIDRFITTWLSKEQDRGGVYRGNARVNGWNGGYGTNEAARHEAEQRASYGKY